MFTFSSQDYKSNEHQNRMQLDHRNRKNSDKEGHATTRMAKSNNTIEQKSCFASMAYSGKHHVCFGCL